MAAEALGDGVVEQREQQLRGGAARAHGVLAAARLAHAPDEPAAALLCATEYLLTYG